MENKIKALITKLKEENSKRSDIISDNACSEYGHTVLVHTYNNTLEIIKQLETIIKG